MSARTQRYRVAGVAAALSVFVTAAPAAANDLEDFLQGAAAAEYSGRRIVITMWDGESKAGIFAVTHVSDMMVIGTGDGGSLVGGGRVADGVNDAVMVHEWSRYTANSRYTTTKPVQTVRLGRTAEMIEIIEDGVVRARFTYDALTKVPLATEIFDPSGRLFRYSAMLEFDPKPELSYADMEAMGEVYDVMHPVEVDSLPDDAAGYVRADTYAGPDGTIQAFFTDGLFSFSLFQVDANSRLDRFDDAASIELNDASYRRLITPTEIWVTWKSGGVAYILVGDLPPDHLEEVMVDLPGPEEPGLLGRLWRGIFG